MGSAVHISLPDDRIRFDGAAWVEATGAGVKAHRIGSAFCDQYPMDTAFVEAMPSGVRMVFDTDATEIGVHCAPVRFQLAGRAEFPAVFDLLVGGELARSTTVDFGSLVIIDGAAGSVDVKAGPAGAVVFEGLEEGLKSVELWLPHNANIEVSAIEIPAGGVIQAAASDPRQRWVHHGSSISHCMEADGPSTSWSAVAAKVAGYSVTNLGLAGQCHVDQFSARTIAGLPADRISLKLGINIGNGDTMRERAFLPAVHGFLDTIREKHPDTPIVLISPIYCEVLEEMSGPTTGSPGEKVVALGSEEAIAQGSLTLVKMRSILAEVVSRRVARGDLNLTYLDGLELFGPADAGDMPDGLHPNAAGYVRMGERFAELDFLA